MNKKGFTLIELLSVIAILAIILVIAVPQVLGMLKGAKEKSLESSAKLAIKVVEQKIAEQEIDGEEYTLNGNCEDVSTWDTINGTCTYEVDANSKIVTILIEGLGKYEGLEASGTKESIVITELIPFVCGMDFTDKRDGKTYKTVKIEEQCWFAEDLKYTTTTCLNAVWNSTAPHNACRLNGGTGWDKDEVLYQWGAAMNGSTTEGAQGLCPAGWYIPTDNDIKILEISLGMTVEAASNTGWRPSNQGDMLKSSSPNWCNNATGCASSGFNKRPAGYRNTDGSLLYVGSSGFWWSSSPSGSSAWFRVLNSGGSDVVRFTVSQADGYSVRCLLGQ